MKLALSFAMVFASGLGLTSQASAQAKVCRMDIGVKPGFEKVVSTTAVQQALLKKNIVVTFSHDLVGHHDPTSEPAGTLKMDAFLDVDGRQVENPAELDLTRMKLPAQIFGYGYRSTALASNPSTNEFLMIAEPSEPTNVELMSYSTDVMNMKPPVYSGPAYASSAEDAKARLTDALIRFASEAHCE